MMIVFLLSMAVPSAVLVIKSLQQLKFEAFFQNREIAEDLASRMDQSLFALLQVEQNRPFGDYGFFQVRGELGANYVARSPISSFPMTDSFPGLIGYFQISPNGSFSTPLLPDTSLSQSSLASTERQQRESLQRQIQQILATNNLLSTKPEIKLPSKALANEYSEPAWSRAIQDRLDTVSSRDSNKRRLVDESPKPRSVSSDLNANDKPNIVQSQAAFDDISMQNAAAQSKRLEQSVQKKSLGNIAEAELEPLFEDKLASRKRAEKSPSKKRESTSKAPPANNSSDQGLNDTVKALRSKSVSREPALVALDDSATDDMVATSELSTTSLPEATAIKFFENEIDPLELALLDSGHWVLFRKVWRQGQRYIQGMLIEQDPFLRALFENDYRRSLVYNVSDLALVYRGNVLAVFQSNRRASRLTSAQDLNGSILYRSKLSAPFDELEGLYTIKHLPSGAGGKVIWWAGFLLAFVLLLGTYLMYRLSLRNLNLVEQQQDFVSSVSHELKTPLTSIRMYGEILKSGWADEGKKQSYYSFIFDESERLTRLINNVLALAKMTRNEVVPNLTPMNVAEVIDLVRSKIDSQVKSAGFDLSFDVELDLQTRISLDADMIVQVMINLIDNALKFSRDARQKRIDVRIFKVGKSRVGFSVRDFGPGIKKEQINKIFELFYRVEGELTRETTGTGIGLALVNQLTQLMNGRVSVENSKPGARFTLVFPASSH